MHCVSFLNLNLYTTGSTGWIMHRGSFLIWSISWCGNEFLGVKAAHPRLHLQVILISGPVLWWPFSKTYLLHKKRDLQSNLLVNLDHSSSFFKYITFLEWVEGKVYFSFLCKLVYGQSIHMSSEKKNIYIWYVSQYVI